MKEQTEKEERFMELCEFTLTEKDKMISQNVEYLDTASIFYAVKFGTKEELVTETACFVESLKGCNIDKRQYQLVFMELVTESLKAGRAYGMSAEAVFGEAFEPDVELKKPRTLDELGEWIVEIGLNIRYLIKKKCGDSTKMLVENAKKYIEEHYSDSTLSVETLCGYLGVSAAYFSTIFKKEAGTSFVAYLTKIRLEHAIELLNHTDEKSYSIAEKVGYAEPNYFSYVFKKRFGMSPTKYREEKRKGMRKV